MLGGIKEEIRAAAEVLRVRATARPRRARPPRKAGEAYDTSRRRYTIAELCRFNFTTFVDHAYRVLLRRPPDAAGFDGHLRRLVAGERKIDILGDLRYSPEGRALGIEVPGLLPRYLLGKLLRLPVLGHLVEIPLAILTLPSQARYQRAADTRLIARTYEIDGKRLELEKKLEAGLAGIDALHADLASLLERVQALQARDAELGRIGAELQAATGGLAETRQWVLGMNHWLTSLRQGVDAIEQAEAAQRAELARIAAATRAGGAVVAPAPDYVALAGHCAGELAAAARVVDLSGDPRWSAALAAHDLAVVDAAQVSATGAGSAHAVDAITAAALRPLLADRPMVEVARLAGQLLRPGGLLLVGLDGDPRALEDRLSGRVRAEADPELFAAMLAATGFSAVERVGEAPARYLRARWQGPRTPVTGA